MKRDEFKRLLNYIANLIALLIEGILFSYIWYTYYSEFILEPFWRRGNWAVIGMYVLIVFFFTRTFGANQIGYQRITDVCLSQTLALLCSCVVLYFQICMIGRDYMNPMPILALFCVQTIIIIPWIYIIRRIFTRLYPPRKTIVIYGEYSPKELISKINSRDDRYDICGTESYRVGYKDLYEKILNYEAVVLCDLPSQIRNQILKFCFDNSIRTYITPKISDIIVLGTEKIHLFDTPLLLSKNQGLAIEQKIAKRSMDIVLSLLAIIILAPIMLIIAILIKMYDGGSVFYLQERLTQNGKIFNIIKFRSMKVDSEKKGARLAIKNDDRVTPIGKILRNIHFDELPQIFNILKGDMSLVGPRPERKSIADQYGEVIPEFSFRLKVKAGLTGYAQVYGKYNTTPYDKLKLDLTYIENYSLLLDFKLLLMTFKVLFQKENTEGVDKEQVTAIKKKGDLFEE